MILGIGFCLLVFWCLELIRATDGDPRPLLSVHLGDPWTIQAMTSKGLKIVAWPRKSGATMSNSPRGIVALQLHMQRTKTAERMWVGVSPVCGCCAFQSHLCDPQAMLGLDPSSLTI